jgi:REP element-mobilizing transposase RayT
MPRALRIEHPGAIYHVMNRGDRREPIFRDDLDHKKFLTTLAEACTKTDWQVHAYCLMGNHFHLVVETPNPNLVAGMKWFLGTYTARFNRRHKLFGHLFSGRYKAIVVDGSGNGYARSKRQQGRATNGPRHPCPGPRAHLNPDRSDQSCTSRVFVYARFFVFRLRAVQVGRVVRNAPRSQLAQNGSSVASPHRTAPCGKKRVKERGCAESQPQQRTL